MLLAISLLITLTTCENQVEHEYNSPPDLLVQFSNKRIWDMEFDSDNNLFLLTSERDTSVVVPITSSHIPMRYCLIKRIMETGELIVLDRDFPKTNQIVFDNDDNIWAISNEAVYLRNDNEIKQITSGGRFDFIAVDNDNNIWVGGCCVKPGGLYKIDKELKITIFSSDNSMLPTNKLSCIHIDKNNNIWVALRDNEGIIKITDNGWEIFNSKNSDIKTPLSIESLITDQNDNLWVGGHDNKELVILKFDGKHWTDQTANYKNNKANESIDDIYVFKDMIFAISWETYNYNSWIRSSVLSFNGRKWAKANLFSEKRTVINMKMDKSQNSIIINSANCIYEIKLE